MTYNGSDKHKIALFEGKQDKLTAGDNISLTPLQDGTVKISASGGAANLDDLGDVDAASPENGQALVYDEEKLKWVPGEAGQVDDVQMNGQSIVQNKVASFKNYVEITQAQYDGLPASKLTDGVLYCIKDTGIVEGDKYAPIIYSLEEREVGVWTDGKPLYQRTFSGSLTPSASSDILFNINTYDIDEIIQADGYLKKSASDFYCVQLGCYLNSNFYSAWYKQGTGNFVLYHSPASYLDTYVITVQYTKTTDVPGSGTWGTDGVPMVHYDGTERIIGTWFGETLYEKTINYGAMGSDLVDNPKPHGIANVDHIWIYDGFVYLSTGRTYGLHHPSDSFGDQWEFYADRTNIVSWAGSDRSNLNAIVTVRYTKSSS